MTVDVNYAIRPVAAAEIPILNDFLYEAIFIPEGTEIPPRDISYKPELQVYVTEFGQRKDDHCLVATVDNEIVGAIWVRIMDDYGHVDDDTPSLAISLYKEYRGQGIGTQLMRRMLTLMKTEGYKQVSLSVQKANYAVGMYKKVGFEIAGENEEELIMVCQL